MAHVAFQNVSKVYSRQSRRFFARYLKEVISGKTKKEGFYALRGVSFEVHDGDTLGIVGHNGAGKSTLLNLVAGLTVPEEGSVDVKGRVMALLELGSGFHPDLTGIENLQMNASLCGLTKQETEAASEAIVEFSELGDFIEEPLRVYSQGMVLRLAFSIAVHVDPDILLLDEVLAVGDKDFHKKCLNRIFEMRDMGKILLCVSHAPDTLRELCRQALWIESGQVVRYGEAAEVFEAYMENGATAQIAR